MTKALNDAPVDRRSVRTRTALRDALIELIGERGWDDIAVQDVCERANIGRSTFYLHYPNKDALLEGGFNGLQAHVQSQSRQAARAGARGGPWPGFGFAPGLIEHVHEQRKIFRHLIGRRSGYVVQQRFRELMIRLIADELPASAGGLPREARVRWLAGALAELLSWWIEQRSPMPPDALAARFNELAVAAVL